MNLKKKVPGVLLTVIIALPAWFLGHLFPTVGSPVFGILFGMLLAFRERTPEINEGIQFTSKKILQLSIVLLGFEMNLFQVLKCGSQTLFLMLFTLSTSFLTAYFVGKALRINSKTTILIGVGTSICGGSAIAATAPVIQAEDEDVAHAISTIFLFNILAVFLFPFLGHLLHLSDTGFGIWAGTAINDTSSVVAAGAAWSSAVGNNSALILATIVKLTRTLMIVPITLFLALYQTKKSAASGSTFHFSKVFPWFVLFFLFAAILNTFLPIPDVLTNGFVQCGKFMIVMAMVSIGLNTHLKKLLKNGIQPILLGLSCWFAVASVSLLVQFLLKRL